MNNGAAALAISGFLSATMQLTIKTITTTLSKGPIASIHDRTRCGCFAFSNNELNVMPQTKGKSTTLSIDSNKAHASTGNHAPASH